MNTIGVGGRLWSQLIVAYIKSWFSKSEKLEKNNNRGRMENFLGIKY